ncbi:MAG: alpha/beta hydrolase-fold protein [Pirellulales bacterium]
MLPCHRMNIIACLSWSLLLFGSAPGQDRTALQQAEGEPWKTFRLSSPRQAGETTIRILLPQAIEPSERLRTVYVLPVEAAMENRYGDGLAEIARNDLHNRFHAAFVAPSFFHLPWYADHPSDKTLQQESYFLEDVIPFVEKNAPVRNDRAGRLLLGFSKSGWGAWSMLLRRPDMFERVAAWDAPMMMQQIGLYGNGPIFGTQANFEQYRVTDLLKSHREKLGTEPRLILTGMGNFEAEHRAAHELLNQLKIPHVYDDLPRRKHDWHSGWVTEAVEHLFAPNRLAPERNE